MSEFTENLKAGDTVIVSRGGFGLRDRVESVERITKTQVILKSGSRFRRSDGGQVGGSSWTSSFLWEATKDKVDEVIHDTERLKLMHMLTNVKWGDMTLDELRNVVAALPPKEGTEDK